MQAGLSTACLYPRELEKAFRFIAESGVKNTEIFVNSHCELSDPYLGEMLDIQREYGIKVASVHPYTCPIEPMMFFTSYERRVTDAIEYYKKFFEYMNIFGAEIFVLHGNKAQNNCPDERYFERFLRLYEAGEEFGICVAQENVARCTSRSLDFLVKMKEALGDKAAFVLDTKQAHRSDCDPIEMVRALGGNVKHVHFSDCGEKGDCLKFGSGDYDNMTFFSELKHFGFDGNVIIELYKEGYESETELPENYRALEKFLAENNF